MTLLADSLDLPSGVRLHNRMAKAALSEALGDADHSPDDRIVTLYRRFFAAASSQATGGCPSCGAGWVAYASVLGSRPREYWRGGDRPGSRAEEECNRECR